MVKKIFLIAGIVIVLLVIGGLVYVNNVLIPRQLKPLVIEKLQQALDKEVRIAKAFYFPFKGVLFSQIDIINKDNTLFLRVDKVDLRLKSFPAIKGANLDLKAKLVVAGLDFKQQDLSVKGSSIVDADIRLNNKDMKFLVSILLDDLNVKGLSGVADVENISGNVVCTQEIFSTEKIRATIAGNELVLKFDGSYTPKTVSLKEFLLTYGKTNVLAEAQIADLASLDMKASLRGSINLEDVTRIMAKSSLPKMSGDCAIEASAQGLASNLARLGAKLKAEILNGSVDKIKFYDAKAVIDLSEGTVTLTPFYLGFYEGKIDAVAKAVLSDKKTLPCEAKVNIEKVNIKGLILDLLGQDMGEGRFDAQAEISTDALDISLSQGGGWFKLLGATVKMPVKFEKVALMLGVAKLGGMTIEQASGTFSIQDSKIESQDLLCLAKEAVIKGKGQLDFNKNLDSEFVFSLSEDFVKNSGDVGQFSGFISDASGTPVAKVRVFGIVPDNVKYKAIPFPVEELFKEKVKQGLEEGIKGLFDQDTSQEGESSSGDIQNQIKKGLKGLFN